MFPIGMLEVLNRPKLAASPIINNGQRAVGKMSQDRRHVSAVVSRYLVPLATGVIFFLGRYENNDRNIVQAGIEQCGTGGENTNTEIRSPNKARERKRCRPSLVSLNISVASVKRTNRPAARSIMPQVGWMIERS